MSYNVCHLIYTYCLFITMFITRILAEHPKFVLIVVFSFMVPLLSYFAFYPLQVHSDVRRGFAQKDGRAIDELMNFANYYDLDYNGLEIWIIVVTAKAPELQMNISHALLEEVEKLDRHVRNFTVDYEQKPLSFGDLHKSSINVVFDWYKTAHSLHSLFPSEVDLTYPLGNVFGARFFFGNHFFGVNKNDPEKKVMTTAEHIALFYMGEATTYVQKKKLETFQMALFELSRQDNFSSLISFNMYGDQIANAEMLRGTMTTVKLFAVGVLLMVLFMMIAFRHLTLKSKLLMMIGGIGAPLLAAASCFALLGWVGIPLNAIMCITPFLILGIGVDDAFLLLHGWRRRTNNVSTTEAVGHLLQEIAPSIAITSFTNCLAFGIGIASPTAQMSSFCLCTAFAVFIDFILEFCVFLPIMIIFYEETTEKLPLEKKTCSTVSWKTYTNILLSVPGKSVVIAATVLLYVFASIGVSMLRPQFDPSKTFPSDSDLLLSLRKIETIQREYAPMNFISRRSPDLSNQNELDAFNRMISELESQPHCYGPERTLVPFREYVQKEQSTNKTDVNYQNLPKFLNDRWLNNTKMMQYHSENGTIFVDGMNYVIICRGSLDWNLRSKNIEKARSIIDRYPQFNTSIFDYDATIYDLIITVKQELAKAVILTFICMGVACGIAIPSLFGASLATLSMLAISFTLLGMFGISSQELDPIIMINVLMAIGFSVDFSAHICYHYHLSIKTENDIEMNERMRRILRAVGKPMIEASVSTVLCMFPLFLVPVYIMNSFAKTVCFVAVLGIAHGVVIIPVVLSLFPVRKRKSSPELQENQPMIKDTSLSEI